LSIWTWKFDRLEFLQNNPISQNPAQFLHFRKAQTSAGDSRRQAHFHYNSSIPSLQGAAGSESPPDYLFYGEFPVIRGSNKQITHSYYAAFRSVATSGDCDSFLHNNMYVIGGVSSDVGAAVFGKYINKYAIFGQSLLQASFSLMRHPRSRNSNQRARTHRRRDLVFSLCAWISQLSNTNGVT